MNRNLATTIIVILIVVAYVITESPLILSLVTVAALSLMIPSGWFKKLCGYTVLTDALASMYVFTSYLGSGTLGSIPIAVFAAFFISVALRLIGQYVGKERLAVNGRTEFRLVAAELLTQSVCWVKAIIKSTTTGKVIAPEKLNVEWREVQAGSTIGKMISSLFVSPVTC